MALASPSDVEHDQLQRLLRSSSFDANNGEVAFNSLSPWQDPHFPPSPSPSSLLKRRFSRSGRRQQCFIVVVVVCTPLAMICASLTLAAYIYRNHDAIVEMSSHGHGAASDHESSPISYTPTLGGSRALGETDFSAQAQASTPPLSEPWDYEKHRILGVNLGGWFVIEPFVRPDLFQPYLPEEKVVDEWTLCQKLGLRMAQVIEEHYNTFITEEDFVRIAAAGLNWVRIPVGWWMIETLDDEPFLEGVSLTYLIKALTWAQRYGIRVNLDLHAVPGSQNAWNHAGRVSDINFLRGAMGVANAERSLNYVKTLADFILHQRWAKVVPMFSVLNEARVPIIGSEPMRHWYLQVYEILRGGMDRVGVGPFMTIHDGFGGPTSGALGWIDFLPGADRIAVDSHVYLGFTVQRGGNVIEHASLPCQRWAVRGNKTRALMGVTVAGEYSLAINDCGLYLNAVDYGTRYEGTFPTAENPDPAISATGSCETWIDADSWTETMKNGFRDLASAHQDALRDSFFWTWKVSPALNGKIESPMWSYEHGLRKNYISQDARKSIGKCSSMNKKFSPSHSAWNGKYQSWQVGHSSMKVMDASIWQRYATWPPPRLNGGPNETILQSNQVYRLVPTGSPKSLTEDGKHLGGKGKWWVKEKNCQYLDPWDSVGQMAAIPICGQEQPRRL